MSSEVITPPPNRPAARAVAVVALAAVTVATLVAGLGPSHGQRTSEVDAPFCALAPQAAHANPDDRSDVLLTARVPLVTPEGGELATNRIDATQGDVVRVAVSSPRVGAIAVHGLLDVRPIAAGERVTVEFRAIYSGRFPVHFHGADGSHFEIAAIEVLPLASALDIDRRQHQ